MSNLANYPESFSKCIPKPHPLIRGQDLFVGEESDRHFSRFEKEIDRAQSLPLVNEETPPRGIRIQFGHTPSYLFEYEQLLPKADSDESNEPQGPVQSRFDLTKMNKPKGDKITPYGGDPDEDLIKWLRSFEYLALSKDWDETSKLKKLPVNLTGTAEIWYSDAVHSLTAEEKTKKGLDSYDEVVRKMKEYFIPAAEGEILRCQLEKLKQNDDDVTKYLSEVKALCGRIDKNMSQTEIMRQMLRGMNPAIARDVRSRKPTTVDQLIKEAKEADEYRKLFPEEATNVEDVVERLSKIELENQQVKWTNKKLTQKVEELKVKTETKEKADKERNDRERSRKAEKWTTQSEGREDPQWIRANFSRTPKEAPREFRRNWTDETRKQVSWPAPSTPRELVPFGRTLRKKKKKM